MNHIDVGHTFCIVVCGKNWYFELSYAQALCVSDKNGNEKKDPPLNHPFWKAVELWEQQGRKIVDGKCVYDPDLERIPITKHIGGNHYQIVGYETVGERRRRLK